MTVIEIKNQTEWFDATLLKKSIAWMKDRNDGRFDQAIDDEQRLLDGFFATVREKVKAEHLSSAA